MRGLTNAEVSVVNGGTSCGCGGCSSCQITMGAIVLGALATYFGVPDLLNKHQGKALVGATVIAVCWYVITYWSHEHAHSHD